MGNTNSDNHSAADDDDEDEDTRRKQMVFRGASFKATKARSKTLVGRFTSRSKSTGAAILGLKPGNALLLGFPSAEQQEEEVEQVYITRSTSNASSLSQRPGGRLFARMSSPKAARDDVERRSRGESYVVESDETMSTVTQHNNNSAGGGLLLNNPDEDINGYIELPRGGYVVRTKSIGAIQFGIPPETIKDSLSRGMSVPKHFVIQGDMFDRKCGLSSAEFEFPIYYQFFLCRSKVNIVTFRDHERRIREALQETLFGPGADCNVAEDYPADTPASALPNFHVEAAALDPGRELKMLDEVVTFTLFDENTNTVQLGDVIIRLFTEENQKKGRNKLMYEVKEHDQVVALVPATIKLPQVGSVFSFVNTNTQTESKRSAKQQAKREYEIEERRHLQQRNTFSSAAAAAPVEGRRSSLPDQQQQLPIRRASTSLLPHTVASMVSLPAEIAPTQSPFDIPVFGVTMMGTSHGFDPQGRTTGFVLWMNRRGLIVDPPPDSSQILEVMGIPPLSIEGVILTHVHADHDAGAFQMILRTKQIKLYTTRTIERSFVKKYSSITGFDSMFLRTLYQFQPVQCGGHNAPLRVYDGEIHFHYSLHTIPCIGLEAYFESYSMAYSADTRFDPDLVNAMHAEGKMGKLRAQQLATFPHDHSLILHEMGVPPIHTPAEHLRKAALDPKHNRNGRPLKDRLFVVHTTTAQRDIDFAKQCDNWLTMRIKATQGKDKKLSEIISVLSNVDWLAPVKDNSMLAKIAKQCKQHEFQLGDTITMISSEDTSESVWIVMSGQVGMNDEVLAVGESFGLGSMLDVLEFDLRQSGNVSHMKRIPGVPLGIEFANFIRRGFTNDRRYTTATQRGGEDDNNQWFKAKSKKCWVVEIPNHTLAKLLTQNKLIKVAVTERLRRFIGWPNDGRWCALQRNNALCKLLTNQFAVREFLENLSDEYVVYPEGHVLQSGRELAKSAFFIKEGVFRVLPTKGHLQSFRKNVPDIPGALLSEEPFECTRGSLVGDFNALIKQEKSPYRVVCLEECHVYHFAAKQLLQWFEEFPGIKFHFIDRVLVGWMLDEPIGRA